MYIFHLLFSYQFSYYTLIIDNLFYLDNFKLLIQSSKYYKLHMNHLTYVENKDMPHYRSIKNNWIIKILFEKFFVSYMKVG